MRVHLDLPEEVANEQSASKLQESEARLSKSNYDEKNEVRANASEEEMVEEIPEPEPALQPIFDLGYCSNRYPHTTVVLSEGEQIIGFRSAG